MPEPLTQATIVSLVRSVDVLQLRLILTIPFITCAFWPVETIVGQVLCELTKLSVWKPYITASLRDDTANLIGSFIPAPHLGST